MGGTCPAFFAGSPLGQGGNLPIYLRYSAQFRQRFLYFLAFGFDQIEQFFGSPQIFINLCVRVDRFQIRVAGFDLFPGDRPTARGIGPRWEQGEKLFESVCGQRGFLADFDIG